MTHIKTIKAKIMHIWYTLRMNIHTQTYILPVELSDSRMDLILEIINTISKNPPKLVISFQKNITISPAGYAVFMCILDSATEHNVTLIFKNLDKKNHTHQKINQLNTQQSSTKGFLNIAEMNYVTSTQINWAKISSIAPEMISKIEEKFLSPLGENRLWNIQLVLNELMQNAVDHSTSERYFIYAGISNNNFEFGVLDRGVSIPSKLEAKYSEDSDQAYLEKSLQNKIGTRRNRVGGLGLFYLFENIKEEKGKLVIISRHGQLRRHFGARKIISTKAKYPLRGCWCFAKIPLVKK